MTKFACPIDAAQHREAEMTEDSLKAIRSLVPEERHTLTEDDLTCEICQELESIQPARALKGYSTCTTCQGMLERNNRQFNRSRTKSYEYDD